MLNLTKLCFRFRFAALCLLLGAGALHAQTAALSGRATDPQGAALTGAQISVYAPDATSALRVLADAQGAFRFERLLPGDYLVLAEAPGFRSATRTVAVTRGAVARLDLRLELAGVHETVVVTAGGAPQTVDQIAKSASAVEASELLERHLTTLSDSLHSLPGVQIRNSGGPGQLTQVRVRGLRADATAILIDGVRFRDIAAPQADASAFLGNLGFVASDRAEVLRGSGSSLYGTNAAGGVVNLVTAEGGGARHGEIEAEGGNLGYLRGRARIAGGALRDRLKYTAGLLHLNVLEGVDGNDRARATALQGRLRFDLSSETQLTGGVLGSDDFAQNNVGPTTTGIPAANLPSSGVIPAVALTPGQAARLQSGLPVNYGPATYVPGRDDPDSRRSSRFVSATAGLQHSFRSGATLQLSLQRVHTDRIYQNGPAGPGFQPPAENYGKYTGDIANYGAKLGLRPASWFQFTGGYEFEHESYFDHQDNNLTPPRLLDVRTSIAQDSHAPWFSSQFSPWSRRLQFSFSGRAQAFALSRPRFLLSGQANNYERVPLVSPPLALTGDFSVSYLLPATSTKLRGHAGNAYRSPSLFERFGAGFYADPVTAQVVFTPYGDPRLAPDRYNSMDAGLDQYLFRNRLRVSATYFYTRVVHVTAFDFSGLLNPATDPYGRSSGYINGSGGISRGAEFGAEARPARGLTLAGAYTYTNADMDRDVSVPGFYRVLGVSPHTASVWATQHLGSRFDVTADLLRVSGYFSPLYAAGRTRAFAFPGYTRLDLTAGYRLLGGDRSAVRLFGKVSNALNQAIYENGWLAPRATVVGGLRYAF